MRAFNPVTLLLLSALCLVTACQLIPGEKRLRITPRVIRAGFLIHPKHEPISCSDPQAREFYGIHFSDMDKIIELTEEEK